VKRKHLISLLAILAACFAVYANSFKNEFVWDDDALIRENAYIKDPACIPKILTSDMGAGAGMKYHYYRPLAILSYMLDYSVWGLDVFGYHLTNVLTHFLAALTAYLLINLLFKNNLLSFLTALFFAVHPVQTELVAYLSGRCDPIAMFFMMLCFICYIKRVRWSVIICYALALMAKESALIMPALLLIYHYALKRKFQVGEFVSVSAMALLYIPARMFLFGGFNAESPEAAGMLERVPGFFVAITNYVRLLILPVGQHIEYGKKLFGMADPWAITGAILATAGLVWAVSQRNRTPLITFSVLWFFAALLPSSNIYPAIAFYMAEHYLYVPSVGAFLLLSYGLVLLYNRERFRKTAVVITALLAGAWALATVRQNNYWKNSQVILEKTLKYMPDSSRVLCDLGNVYNNQGRHAEAARLIEKALGLDPQDEKAYNNLGNSYYAMGETAKAIAMYKKALELGSDDARTYNNLANAYAAEGRTDEAVSAVKKAIAVNPYFAGSYYNLGVIYMNAGKNEDALEMFRKAAQADPDMSEAYVNIAAAAVKTGRPDEAEAALKKAIAVRPDYGKAYYNLAVLYSTQKKDDLADEYYKRARQYSHN
jgi:tetratricopeptide (TPR) repeat protein